MTTSHRGPRIVNADAPGRRTDGGPVVRVVLGSLALGVVGAAASTLIVFAGAPEHVILGWALVSFAAGWTLLAALSGRLTTRPLRWAYVPGGVLAAAGLGLLALAPGDTALTRSGWVWPPMVFTLACWIGARVHRTVPGRVRWLLYAVASALALACVGGFAETIQRHGDAGAAMPGTSYDLGGRALHMHCVGAGSPTVVLESGLNEMSSNWAWVAPAAGRTTRVCAYDRAGQGWSSDAASPADGRAVADDLHGLLSAAGEHLPVVLVGHSTGGIYAMTYAVRYPNDVAGMVLLDSSTPYQFDLPGYADTYSMLRRAYGVAQGVARLGVGLLVPDSVMSSLPAPASVEVADFALSPRGLRNARDELAALPAAFDQAKALHTLGDRPLAVVTATDSLRDTVGWSAAQSRLAALSTNAVHRVVDATHSGLLDDQHMSTASVSAIAAVVAAVRSHTPIR